MKNMEILSLNAIDYINGVLHVERADVNVIAESIGTPFYCYSSEIMLAQFNTFVSALMKHAPNVYFAVKANSNVAVIKTLGDAGAGADVVSIGELERSLKAGISPRKIVFSGGGKTREELSDALKAGIGQINIESEPELFALSEVGQSLGIEANVSLRVNPNVDARTHVKITTGRKENKFGVSLQRAPDIFALATSLPAIQMRSLSVHIGSQILDFTPYQHAYAHLSEMTLHLREIGYDVDNLDLGGGLGVPYEGVSPPDLKQYAQIVSNTVGKLGCQLSFEPGRFLVAEAGILVTRVIYIKHSDEKRFVIVDAGMNDLIRPTLYEAYHEIIEVNQISGVKEFSQTDVVGPICESGDYLSKNCVLPEVSEGDLLAVKCAGAYGATMSSTYNSRPLIPEILVKGVKIAEIRRRQSVSEALEMESMPNWL